MSEYPFNVNRDWQRDMYYLFESIDPNYVYHGFNFENDTFIIRPFYGEDCECEPDIDDGWETTHTADCPVSLPNFHYKPTGFKLQWYKYPLRASEMNQNLSYKEFREIIDTCVKSLNKGETKNG
ncbi:MAG: hypothetical protein KGO96_07090 [Elusimicrobia bacterium]|nr:hypothetical protein [Elusimicrobiota bacterium]